MDDDLRSVIEKMLDGYRAMPTGQLHQLATQLWDELFSPGTNPYLVDVQVKRLRWVMILNVLNEREK